MKVLSLFDGMSCGRIALEILNIPVEKYYSSEIDKWAIQVTQHNYPETIQLGDITKWREWDINWSEIDLIQGGSPCQGFSFAGKQLNFDDPRSKLFFVFVDILNHTKEHNPNVKFLLENVRMKKEYQDVITEYLGVEPVEINSALVSAQSRKRLYWTNIGKIEQPEDKEIFLKDIIEDEVDEKYYMNDSWHIWWNKNREFQLKKKYSSLDADKAITMTARQYASWNGNFIQRLGNKKVPYLVTRPRGKNKGSVNEKKSSTLSSSSWEHNNFLVLNGAVRGRYTPEGKTKQQIEIRVDGKTNTLTTVQKDNVVLEDERVRRLTPREAERLQTVPDDYSAVVSDRQRYKMLGNGWTVDVIAHIYKNLI